VMKALFRQRFDLIAGAAFTRLLTLSTRKHDRSVRLISWGSCDVESRDVDPTPIIRLFFKPII